MAASLFGVLKQPSLLLVLAVYTILRPAAAASSAEVAAITLSWMDAVVKQSSPQDVAALFCEDGLLVATAGVGIRKQNVSEDGWGRPKAAGTTIRTYFDWFATLPGQNITQYHNNIASVTEEVWVNNAWVNWTWEGNPGLVARMTFVVRSSGTGLCIYELHSSQLPEPRDSDGRRLRSTPKPDWDVEAAALTTTWMNAVVHESDPQRVAMLFCEDGLLVATAGGGIRMKDFSEDGWGERKADGITIESYFDWFAALPEQNITKFNNNLVKVTDDVWINNAWVNWAWEGNPGLTARMTFIFRESPVDLCIFELHSSQLPNPAD